MLQHSIKNKKFQFWFHCEFEGLVLYRIYGKCCLCAVAIPQLMSMHKLNMKVNIHILFDFFLLFVLFLSLLHLFLFLLLPGQTTERLLQLAFGNGPKALQKPSKSSTCCIQCVLNRDQPIISSIPCLWIWWPMPVKSNFNKGHTHD